MRVVAFWVTIFLLLPYTVEIKQAKGKDMNDKSASQLQSRQGRNHLAGASSPYLLAHADNPVNWYEWGEEAFARARSEDKPIFLSIGYNACHWCHVMEHESFENQEIADLLNKYFISIKVDREERPDIDQIYMSAVTAMTGSGGWPMSIFMTPEKKPFFAGTYFAPETRYGRPGFKYLVTELAKAYREKKAELYRSAQTVVDHIVANSAIDIPPRPIDRDVVLSAADVFHSRHDHRFGGFDTAPKFPQAGTLSLLFRAYNMTGEKKYGDAAYLTLRKMAEGGIYDHLGGGFHRYSVDQEWLVPHFEKMLYDNALLVIPYLEAYQLSGEPFYLSVVNGTLSYLQAEMTDPEGGLYSTQDADSEGEEGKYYVWNETELADILGPDADWFGVYFGVSEDGNFEHGQSILSIGEHSLKARQKLGIDDDEFEIKLAQLKGLLYAHRMNRVPPAKDDKVLASWNGLAISAFAQAYLVTGRESYLKSAQDAADFILKKMIVGNRFHHSYRRGRLLDVELLEDYAYFVAGLIDLYQASLNEFYLHEARKLTRRAVDLFSDKNIFYTSPADDKDLVVRPLDFSDGSTPSAASIMISNLLRLAAITGDAYFNEKGEAALWAVSGLAARSPLATASLILAGHFGLDDPIEIVIVGDDRDRMKSFNREVFSRYIPNKIVVGTSGGSASELPLLIGRQDARELTYYFCRNQTCRLPVTDRKTLKEELDWLISEAP